MVEELGDEAGEEATLRIIEIPDNIDWYIDKGIGVESIHEAHKIWNADGSIVIFKGILK